MSITITEVRNARSTSADNTAMIVEINHPKLGWTPYGLDPTDTDMTIDNAQVLNIIGSDFAPYVAPTQAELDAQAAASVRAQRDALLVEVDAMVSNPLRWADMTTEQQTAWSQYRTDLLNVPQQDGFPHGVTWPTKPEGN